ncbi:DUF3566 domain-containing protein [Amycolatopsis acidicola]|uniref:DUF3566 domain-containing protein n=1 Tax=Amycolatopsis acidicola TaxID=2596893 RepID=A0A5N0VPG5_9PSEU|nr:DUF3566 domain-containing protein [Amycolatopsis acidicola]KAA9166712.1 DUF3566 domain-containing protein [Amycolatopsis acidicola]
MTSPENSEQPTATGEAATPPWQRLSKDASGNGKSETTSEQWFPGGQAGESVLYSNGGGDEQPVVTGTAAQGLFGNPGPSQDDALAGLRGQETVSVAGPGVKQRSAPSALRRPGRGPRRASLQVKRFDPWSVLKLSLVLGVAMFFVWLVAVGVLYTVLDGMGVWDKLNGTYSSLVSGDGGDAPADPLISAGRVFGIAAILGAINIVLISALATVSAFIYNVSADLAGGLEVTLSERE